MKLLKDLKINGRVDKILNFDKDDEANNTYIVKQQAGSPITLFELSTKENYVSDDNAPRSLNISGIEKEVDNNCVTIKITFGDKLSPVLQNCQYYNSDMGQYSPKEILNLQEKLNEQIESAHKIIAQDQSINEMCGQLADSQEAIRQKLEECHKELKGGDENNRKMAKEIYTMMQQMEVCIKDLKNGPIRQQTNECQQKILKFLQQHANIENLNGIIYNTITNNKTQAHQLQLKKAEKPHIILQFGVSGILQKKIIHIYVEDVVYNAIVDFGSEASQACWLSDDNNPKYIKLTTAIRNASDLGTYDDADFIQYEQDENKDFYRSIYYIKEELTDSDSEKLDVWPDYKDDTIRFLWNVKDETKNEPKDKANTYIQIPNTKILNYITDGYANNHIIIDNEKIEIKDIKEGVIPTLLMNNIILQTLLAIEKVIKIQKNSGKACGLILYVLMPNIYPIHIVSQKLNQLAENIKKIKENKDKKYNKYIKDNNADNDNNDIIIPHINGIELRYISESDASLLGYINLSNNKLFDNTEKKDYLIIDAGKGTLDFSLTEVHSKNAITNKRRGGIVGAGAAITYGVLVGLVNEYLTGYCKDYDTKPIDDKEHLIQTFIFNQILKCPDIAIVNKTMKNIEEYKKVHNSYYGKGYGDITPDSTLASTFEDLTLKDGKNCFNNVVKSWIENRKKLSEKSAKYVTAEIELIVQEALTRMISSLYNEKANVVVFTGRGCLMKELRAKLKEGLIALNLLDDTPGNEIVAEKTMKTGCMHINQLLKTGSYDTAESRQSYSIEYLFGGTDGKNNNVKDSKNNNGENDLIEFGRVIISHGVRKIKYYFRGIRPNENYGNLAHGIELEPIKYAMSRINIGGYSYNIDQNFTDKKCKLYYDGEKYIIAANETTPEELGNEVLEVSKDARLGFESLFPNITIQDTKNERMVVIPKFEEETEEMTTPTKEEKEETTDTPKNDEAHTNPTNSTQELQSPGEFIAKLIKALPAILKIKK